MHNSSPQSGITFREKGEGEMCDHRKEERVVNTLCRKCKRNEETEKRAIQKIQSNTDWWKMFRYAHGGGALCQNR